MMQNDNARERDVERRLGRIESPEPPADLLDRIRDDVPDYLRPVNEPPQASPTHPGRYRLLAASLLLAAAGGLLAYRVLQEAPEPSAAAVERPAQEILESRPTAPTGEADGPTEESTASGTETPKEDETTGPIRSGTLTKTETDRRAPAKRPEPEGSAHDAGVTAPPTTSLGADDEARRERGKRLAPEAVETRPDPQAGAGSGGLVTAAPSPRPTATATEPAFPVQSAPQAVAAPRHPLRKLDEYHGGIEVGGPAPPPSPGPSTGGTTEPNDQPWGDMFFQPYGTNPFVDTEDDARSTFALDVDTGAYTLARGYLERGHLPPSAAIRVEEFVNFFDYRDPAPRRGEFTLTAEGAPSPWQRGPRYQLLRIGLHAREISAARRKDATLVFVVDVSGSMGRGNRLELVRQALRLLLGQLGPGDRVGLVVYGSRGEILLPPTGDLEAVRRAVDRLTPGGSTNAEEGLLLGYGLARRHYREGAINRLVLCSDGVANVGNTGPDSILSRIGREAEEGIELTTVGFGMGNYNDVLMEQLADRGDGNYAYVDTLDEARRVFVENLTGTLQTVASDAKIQVEFDPRAVTRYRLLGYENRDVADDRFRDDTVDAGEIGAGHRVSALYEIKLAEGVSRHQRLAEVRLRYRSKASGRMVEDSLEVRRSELAPSWRAAPPTLRLAALAAELAEVLKRSYWAREIRPEELRRRAQAVARDFGDDRDVAELVWLTERAVELIDWPEAWPDER